jgi:hypothetical protein
LGAEGAVGGTAQFGLIYLPAFHSPALRLPASDKVAELLNPFISSLFGAASDRPPNDLSSPRG